MLQGEIEPLVGDVKDLTPAEYERIRKLVYTSSGINLGDQKTQLVRARLGKLVRAGQFGSFKAYCDHVEQDVSGQQLCALLDAISTNTTHLYRESRHFQILGRTIRQWAEDAAWRRNHNTLRIWSAASSSGEEPHSLAMTAHDALRNHPGIELKILATDISTRMLARAQAALYESHRVGTLPPEYRQRYLREVEYEENTYLQVVPELRKVITFARFNLMTPTFNFRFGFDVIFCRNVMIYFDRPTQQTLINKLAKQLHPGGFLMVGHSESLNGIEHPLKYVEPSVYAK